MPERETIERARKDAREGKSPSTQAGEFVREEIHHIREGKHGAASTKQAIAIALSKARKAGVKLPPPPETFPYGIYSVPEISTVGQSEEQVRSAGIPYEVGVARFRETSRGHIMGVDSGFLKLVFSIETRRLLGAHIVGEGATELIHIGQAVINLGGTVDFFVNNTFNYPTLAECYKVAAFNGRNKLRSV